MRNVTIAHVMTPAPATVAPTTAVIEAERVMRAHACHHLPVVEAGKVVGMLASVDLLKALVLHTEAPSESHRASLVRRCVADVMQRDVRVLGQTATLLDTARALGTGALHALPVVAADGHLVGIVTSTDVIQALAEDLEHAPGGGRAAPATGHRSDDLADPSVRALRDVYRAARNYLGSGHAESEHARLVQATERARDALRSAGLDLPR